MELLCLSVFCGLVSAVKHTTLIPVAYEDKHNRVPKSNILVAQKTA